MLRPESPNVLNTFVEYFRTCSRTGCWEGPIPEDFQFRGALGRFLARLRTLAVSAGGRLGPWLLVGRRALDVLRKRQCPGFFECERSPLGALSAHDATRPNHREKRRVDIGSPNRNSWILVALAVGVSLIAAWSSVRVRRLHAQFSRYPGRLWIASVGQHRRKPQLFQ